MKHAPEHQSFENPTPYITQQNKYNALHPLMFAQCTTLAVCRYVRYQGLPVLRPAPLIKLAAVTKSTRKGCVHAHAYI